MGVPFVSGKKHIKKVDEAQTYDSIFNDSNTQNINNTNEKENTKSNKDKKLKEKALEYALDIRKFEIELYWKRASYFWTFIGVIFAGYFLVLSKLDLSKNLEFNGIILFILSCLGFVFTYCWYLVNRGSKFWQNNWERHVDMLEDDYIGPLYKTAINMQSFNFWKLHKEYPYSVSKVNQLLSIFIFIIWITLAIWTVWFFKLHINQKSFMLMISLITSVFTIIVSIAGISTSNLKDEKDNRDIFITRDRFLK